MYSVRIRDHIMIAHSLHHEGFGIASQLHGATYIVDATFFSPVLNEMNVVVDIGLAAGYLKKVLSHLHFRNLDTMEEFRGSITTTEFLAAYVHRSLAGEIKPFFSGVLRIELGESHVAWASYEGDTAT